MCLLYLRDMQHIILLGVLQIVQLDILMIEAWIDSVMTLQGQYFFLDHRDIVLFVWLDAMCIP